MSGDRIIEDGFYWDAERIEVQHVDIGPHVVKAMNRLIAGLKPEITLNLSNHYARDIPDQHKSRPGVVVISEDEMFGDPHYVCRASLEEMLDAYVLQAAAAAEDDCYTAEPSEESVREVKEYVVRMLESLANKYR